MFYMIFYVLELVNLKWQLSGSHGTLYLGI